MMNCKSVVFSSSFIIHHSSFLNCVRLFPALQLARDAPDCVERVYLCGGLVFAQAKDAWEAQRVPALMSLRLLHAVERDFQNYLRLDDAHAPVCELLQGVRAKSLGQLHQLRVRQTRVSLADVQKLRVILRTAHGEGVIGE
ncbi:MAG: hypothetical protein QOH51_2601 [Acidobacteriota bacterium]|nr:hypothetical protein [Acidobacteriota bacterium]